jgi:hypothetical protein
MRCPWIVVAAAVAASCPSPVARAQSSADVQGASRVSAVWVEHEIDFTYMGLTSYYSCDGLRDKLRWILEQIGAKPGFRVTTRGCVRMSGPELMPGARIVAALPAEATPEVLEKLASEATKRELVARATGGSEAAQEATAQFPARPRQTGFKSSPNGRIQDGDCELMQQVRDRVLVPMGARILEDDVRCAPRSVSMGSVRLVVETLEPEPEP